VNDMQVHAAIVPFSELERMAAAIAKSGLFGMKTADQALALMLTAQAEGLHPATITQDYDIIQGRAARKTNSVLARFQQAGGRIEWHELTDTIADATFSHASAGSVRIEWTLEQAKRIGLTGKDNWKNYPRAMLRARCIAEGVRASYPAAIGGSIIAEEALDLPPADHAVAAVSMPRAKSEAAPDAAAVMPRAKAPVEDAEVVSESPFESTKPGSAAPVNDVPVNASMLKMLRAKLDAKEKSAADLCAAFAIADLTVLPVSRINEALRWATA